MSEDFSRVFNDFFDKLQTMKKKSASMSLDYKTYQAMTKETLLLEQEGTKKLTELLHAARAKQSYALANQIEEVIRKWQQEIDEFRKYLKRKSPSA